MNDHQTQAVLLLMSVASDENQNYAVREAALEGLGYAGGGLARAFLMDLLSGRKGEVFGHSHMKIAAVALGRAAALE